MAFFDYCPVQLLSLAKKWYDLINFEQKLFHLTSSLSYNMTIAFIMLNEFQWQM